MKQAEEAAAEAEAERHGAFRLEEEGAVVETEFFKGVAEQGVFVGVHGVEACEDHGLDVFKAGELRGGGIGVVGNGIADLGVAYGFDGGAEEANLAGGEFGDLNGFGRQDPNGLDIEGLAVGHEADVLALAQGSLHHPDEDDDAAVGVEPGVENEGLERRIGVALGRGQAMDDGLEHVRDALAGLGADRDGVSGVQSDCFLNGLLGCDRRRPKEGRSC